MNNLKPFFSQHDWQTLDLDPKKRAQDLNIQDFVNMAAYYAKFN